MRFRKFGRSEDGAVLVEFAFILPILLLIVWVIIDFARAYYTVNSLATAVREGARMAAAQADPALSEPAIKQRVRQAFNPFGGDSLTDDKITLSGDWQCQIPCQARVTVKVEKYEWRTTTPITFFNGGKVEMTDSATFRWEREGT